MSHHLSLFLTHELADILESKDWEALEEFICLYGYDENEETHNE